MKPKVMYIFAALLVAFNIYAGVKDVAHDRYIEQTLRRDSAQEQCLTEQAVWLQDWLQWRWVRTPAATSAQVGEYMAAHPQPQCTITLP